MFQITVLLTFQHIFNITFRFVITVVGFKDVGTREAAYIDEVSIGNSVKEKLQERINDITHTLPDDLKDILYHGN